MNLLKNFSLILLLFLFIFSCHETDPGKQKIISSCNEFMEDFRTGNIDEAFEKLKQVSVIEPEKIDTLAATADRQMKSISGSFRKFVSYSLVKEKEVSDFLIELIYILKFENSFLKFKFILYKTRTGWKINQFAYNDELDELFQ